MPAYRTEIPKYLCVTCKGWANHEVFNKYNASLGYFCLVHAKQEVHRLDQTDKENK